MNSDLRTQNSALRPPTSDLRPPTSDLRPPISDLCPPTSDFCPPPSIIVLNSAFQISEDQVAQLAPPKLWARIAPASGEKSAATPDGKIRDQRFSPESNARVVANFAPEVLVDREHNSILTGDTTAMAWISELKTDADGLHAAFNCTDIGWDALKNRRLRFPSAVFQLDAQGFPTRLLSCAFTNRHNLKQLAPILNKEATAAAPIAATTASATPTPATQGEQMDKNLLALLGLAENADAPAVLNKVKEIVSSLATAQTALKDFQTAALNKEADDFVKANAAKIKDPAKVKAQFVLNKDVTIALFGAVADIPAETHQVINREDGKTPDNTVLNVESNKATAREAAVAAARTKYNCATQARAWELAARDNPALFN
jgi:phage I-like protein